MTSHPDFATALKLARKQKGLTQEDFSMVSSRTYLSTLERGMKSPTLHKIDQLATVIGIHPVSLIALAYLQDDKVGLKKLCEQVLSDLRSLQSDK